MGNTCSHLDSALYSLVTGGILKGLNGVYVDYLICAGDCDFQKFSLETNRELKMEEDSSNLSAFNGFVLDK